MSLRMGSNRGSSRINVLDKKVPRNPRYAGVQSKVKTGMTVDKLAFVTTRQHLRRQEEPYFRLTPAQLHELLTEYEQDRQEGVQDFYDHIDPDHHGPRVVEHEADATPIYERPYLIVDVRCPDDFRRCRITQARSFEGKLLNQDRMTPELYTYRNKEGGLIVLYSNDDKDACHAARTLIHRGFDNVFVLSGGLVAFARSFHSFVEGDVAALRPMVLSDSSNSTGGGGSTAGTSRGRRSSVGGSTANNGEVSSTNGGGSSSSRRSSSSVRGIGSSVNGGRLDYRGNTGESVVVRGGFSDSSLSGSSAAMRSRVPLGSKGGGGGGRSTTGSVRGPRSARSGMESFSGSVNAAATTRSSAGVAGTGGGLREAVAAASAARRRSMEGGRRGEGDASRASVGTVADSVISRATARRGKW